MGMAIVLWVLGLVLYCIVLICLGEEYLVLKGEALRGWDFLGSRVESVFYYFLI